MPAVEYLGYTNFSASKSGSITIPANTNCVVVCSTCGGGSLSPAPTATLDGVAMTHLASILKSTNTGCVAIFIMMNPPIGTYTVNVTVTSGTWTYSHICATYYSNVGSYGGQAAVTGRWRITLNLGTALKNGIAAGMGSAYNSGKYPTITGFTSIVTANSTYNTLRMSYRTFAKSDSLSQYVTVGVEADDFTLGAVGVLLYEKAMLLPVNSNEEEV